jgi:Domain of unknown function (DUF4824)
MKWTRRHSLAAGLALIALTDTVALVGAAYNRSGEPESVLRLTQRELRPPYYWAKRENSGIALKLQWRVLVEGTDEFGPYTTGSRWNSPQWLDKEKMRSLGFDVDRVESEVDDQHSFVRQRGRDVLLVLEFDGPAYQSSLAHAVEAAAHSEKGNDADRARRDARELKEERTSRTRIFVIDAGLDAAPLRAKYADRSRYAIVHGQVQPAERGEQARRPKTGRVADLSVDEINVPIEFRDVFEGASSENTYGPVPASKVAYEASIAFGQRLEPWMTGATRK